MGFSTNVGEYLRKFWKNDKEQKKFDIRKGYDQFTAPMNPYSQFQQYGNSSLEEYLRLEGDLLTRYSDYTAMDDYPELSTALNIYGFDATQPSSENRHVVWATSTDHQIQKILNRLFHRVLRLDEEMFEIARGLCKYGNSYDEIQTTEEGVIGLFPLPTETVRRIETLDGELMGFVQDMRGRLGFSTQDYMNILHQRSKGIADVNEKRSDYVTAFEPYEIMHTRLRFKQRRTPYGQSILDPARSVFKRLLMMEDSMMMHRLERAPERFAFYVDTGDLPPAEAFQYVNRFRQQIKKKKFINPNTNQMDLKYDALNQLDDFFLPQSKDGRGSKVDVLGAPQWASIDDIEYLRSKLFAAIQVPKAYFGQEDGVNKAILSAEDVRFARTILGIQQELVRGLRLVCRTHLAALHYDPDTVDFEVHMTIPSAIYELTQMEVRNARADLAARMQGFFSMRWILRNIFECTDSEIEQNFLEKKEDVERDAEAQARAQEIMTPQQPMMPGMPGSDPSMGGMAPQVGMPDPNAGQPQPLPPSPVPQAENRNQRKWFGLPKFNEKELMEGNREHEKAGIEKFQRLLKNDDKMMERLNELKGLMRDITFSQYSSSRK